MNLRFTILLPLFFGLAAAQAQNVSENAFFKALTGSWRGSGELVDAEGKTTEVNNRIEAKFDDDGESFKIRGNLKFDQQELPYTWIYRASAIEGLYEANYVVDETSNLRLDSTYEVAIDESTLTARLNQNSGVSGSARIVFEKKIEDGKFVVKLSFVDPNENTTLNGTVTFEREE